ncbi:hypothetical protein BJ165DRAFT_1523957 [Panaeolus papilionaceus]|nr:hypothetical protein BJ165DRAFT_1523957 [Panaeolus papilionaceus]
MPDLAFTGSSILSPVHPIQFAFPISLYQTKTPLTHAMNLSYTTGKYIRSRREVEAERCRQQIAEERALRMRLAQRRMADLAQGYPNDPSFEAMVQRGVARLDLAASIRNETPNPIPIADLLREGIFEFRMQLSNATTSPSEGNDHSPKFPSSLRTVFAPKPQGAMDKPFTLRGVAELLARNSPEPSPPPLSPTPSPSPPPLREPSPSSPSPPPLREPSPSSPSPPPLREPSPSSPSPPPLREPTPPPRHHFRPLDYDGDLDQPLPAYKKNGPFVPAISYLPWKTNKNSKLRFFVRNRPSKQVMIDSDEEEQVMNALLASDNPPKYGEIPQYDNFMDSLTSRIGDDIVQPKPGEDQEFDRLMTENVRRVCGDPDWTLPGSETFQYGTPGQSTSGSNPSK